MTVIIEGVDGSGKSTLVKQLADEGFRVATVESNRVSRKEFIEWETLSMYQNDEIVITDRSFLTDLVYRIHDGKERKGMDLYHMSMVLDENVKVVFCETGTEFDDAMARGEDNITSRAASKDISDIYRVVREMVRLFTKTPVFVYNWHDMSVSDVINFIYET